MKAENKEYVCKKGYYRANGKAVAMDETEGLIKLMIDTSDNKIIGCHAFGAHSSDIIQEVAALMNTGVTTDALANIIHTHPTLSEVLHEIVC